MKNKMSEEKKTKLIYSGELIIIALVFLTIAILELTYVIDRTDKKHIWFNWVTIFGGTWMIVDFIWALVSKKRRKRICLLDKILTLPIALYLIAFDIYCFINNPVDGATYQLFIPIAFIYISIIYIFEGIYHWYKPIPGLFDDIKPSQTESENFEEKKDNQ